MTAYDPPPLTTARRALPGVGALWPLCLAMASHRRGAAPAPVPDMARRFQHHPSKGFVLDPQGWHPEALELFSLLKPVLDQPSEGPTWVIGQLGQSLDGCIATRGGDANFVNGPEMLLHLHRLRALCDAVIVGAATAAIDNPQLTTRRVAGEHPVRVLIDPTLRLAPTLRVFTDGQAPTLLVCDALRQAEAAAQVGAEQVLGVPGLLKENTTLDLPVLLHALRERGLRVLFVEGGGVTVSRFIAQGCMDRLHLSIAPVLIGSGRPGLSLPVGMVMRDCPRPPATVFRMGADVLWDLDLRASASAI